MLHEHSIVTTVFYESVDVSYESLNSCHRVHDGVHTVPSVNFSVAITVRSFLLHDGIIAVTIGEEKRPCVSDALVNQYRDNVTESGASRGTTKTPETKRRYGDRGRLTGTCSPVAISRTHEGPKLTILFSPASTGGFDHRSGSGCPISRAELRLAVGVAARLRQFAYHCSRNSGCIERSFSNQCGYFGV